MHSNPKSLLWLLFPVLLLTLFASSPQAYDSNNPSSFGVAEDRSYYELAEIAEIPADILVCYHNRTLWDRFERLPSSMDSLAAIIRKIELHPKIRNWSPGKLAATLIHKFRFDGIIFDRCIDTSTGNLPFRIDMQVEFPKMDLIYQLISGRREDFPEDVLDMEEHCSLHWMLSYAVNTTYRIDELFWTTDYENSGAWSIKNPILNHRVQDPYPPDPPRNFGRPPYNPNPGLSRDCYQNQAVSKAPWEMGVIWTSSGPVTAGTVIAGFAAGLQPELGSWGAGQIDNGWAASLAGDLAQTSVLKRRGERYVGPDGHFNSTICPAEFYLKLDEQPNNAQSFSHLTVAEINAGIDGLLLAEFSSGWQHRSEITLSQVLEMYYSAFGINVAGKEPLLCACERYSNYLEYISGSKLRSEAYVFGYEYKSKLVLPFDNDALKGAIEQAHFELNEEINLLDAALNNYGPCAERRARERLQAVRDNLEQKPIDFDALSFGIADVSVVLDTSIFDELDSHYMKQVAGAIANNLDIWTTIEDNANGKEVYVNGGSYLEVVDGRYGNVITSSAYKGPHAYTNKAELSCSIVRNPVPITGELDPGKALETVAVRMATRNAEEESDYITPGRAMVIVLVMFGRVETSEKRYLAEAVHRVNQYYPGIKLLVVTRWAPIVEFQDYVDWPEYDVFQLNSNNYEESAEFDGRRIASRIGQIAAQMTYTNCDEDDPDYRRSYNERDDEEIVYVLPNTQRFLQIDPHYFRKVKDFELTFFVEYNSVDVCWSRLSPEERLSGEFNWNEKFEGNEVCRSGTRIEIGWDSDPCEGESEARCPPIHIRLEGKDTGGLQCETEDYMPCRSATAALVTVVHNNMRCGASACISSSILLLLLSLRAVFTLFSPYAVENVYSI